MADQGPFLLNDEDFWSIMDNEEARAHLQREACRVSEMIFTSSAQKEKPTLNLSTTQQNHTPQPSQRLVDLIRPSKARQRSSNLQRLPSSVYWTLINNKYIREHIGEQAKRVVEMINEEPWLVKKEQATVVDTVSSEVNLHSSDSELTSSAPDKLEQETASLEQDKIELPQMCEKVKSYAQNYSAPKKNPEQILDLLDSDRWEDKLNALTSLQDLAKENPESLKGHLRKMIVSVSVEVKNLRSVVSGAAINTLSVMFTQLKKAMNDTITETGGVLLRKLCDSRAFIQQQANEAVACMVDNCNPLNVLNILFNVGLNHRNSAVRTCAALNISRLLDVVGPKRFSQLKDFSKVFVVALSMILKDGSADVRKHGMTIYQKICHNKDFQSCIPEKDWSLLQGFICKLKEAPRRTN